MADLVLTQEQENNKALQQFENAISKILEIYNLYGLGIHNERWQVTYEIEKVAMQLFARLQGIPNIDIGDDSWVSALPTDPDE